MLVLQCCVLRISPSTYVLYLCAQRRGVWLCIGPCNFALVCVSEMLNISNRNRRISRIFCRPFIKAFTPPLSLEWKGVWVRFRNIINPLYNFLDPICVGQQWDITKIKPPISFLFPLCLEKEERSRIRRPRACQNWPCGVPSSGRFSKFLQSPTNVLEPIPETTLEGDLRARLDFQLLSRCQWNSEGVESQDKSYLRREELGCRHPPLTPFVVTSGCDQINGGRSTVW